MTMSRRIQTFAVAALLLSAPGWAQEESAAPPPEEIVEQILDLQRRIEELMAALPPEARAELRRRLAAMAAPAPAPKQTGKPPRAMSPMRPRWPPSCRRGGCLVRWPGQ